MTEFRIEKDSMGDVKVPAKAYYGAQTQRAVENFPISGQPLPTQLIHALGLVKVAAAIANHDLGKLKHDIAEPIILAAREVAAGKYDEEFPIDVYQTGSGTSSNMNANEVISNRAIEIIGGDRFDEKKPIHPNDHVNMGQSTNDMFPTAIHVAAGQAIAQGAHPRAAALPRRARREGEGVGRHHQDRPHASGRRDADPPGPGVQRLRPASWSCASTGPGGPCMRSLELPAGGTAVGTGINTHPKFGDKVAEVLAKETGVPFVEADEPLRGQRQPRRPGRMLRPTAVHRRQPVLDRQQHPLARLRPALRLLRDHAARPASPARRSCRARSTRSCARSMMQACARVIGNDQCHRRSPAPPAASSSSTS